MGSDTLKFKVDTLKMWINDLKEDIKDIRVVPNPYVGTNAMEEGYKSFP